MVARPISLVVIIAIFHFATALFPVRILLITSPSPMHLSENPTAQIWDVINSIGAHTGLSSKDVNLHIICDGVRTRATSAELRGKLKHPYCMSKLGVITDQGLRAYESYKQKLRTDLVASEFGNSFQISELSGHHGFAHAVKFGLIAAKEKGERVLLVCQHDRKFTRPIDLRLLLSSTLEHDQDVIRYVGLSTSSSISFMDEWEKRYSWSSLIPTIDLKSNDEVPGCFGRLHSLAFWYDSTHIAFVDRYLEMFSPFKCMNGPLQKAIGGPKAVSKLVLKKGDFIEDKVGQQQRQLYKEIMSLRTPRIHAEKELLLVELTKWFGCYMFYPEGQGQAPPSSTGSQSSSERQAAVVGHIGGRKYPYPWPVDDTGLLQQI